MTQERDFPLARYQVTLPVAAATRRCAGSSTTCSTRCPSAALEELTLKREAIDDDALEARVRFTLFLGRE